MISAVVVNYNGAGYLPACLGALTAQQPPPDEILLVDNQSTDDSLAIVASRFPGVLVLPMGRNAGPCAARNRGVAAARHDLVLLLDNDVVLEPGALAALQRELQQHPEAAVAQARSFCGDRPEVIHYDGADLHFLGTLVLHHWFQPETAAEPDPREVGAAIALCMLVRRQQYEAVGGFDERLFILYEDNEFSYKLRMRGQRIRLCSLARCRHLQGTAGLSVRKPQDDYSARRTFLHARNRWYVLFTCMRWRTLLLTVPAQLLYGVVYAAFGAQRGHLFDWLRAKWELLRLLPAALARRRIVQRGRTVPDRDLLVAAPLTLNPGLADRGFKAGVRRAMDRCFAGYWLVVRRLCG